MNENEVKRQTDDLAGRFLKLDDRRMHKLAREISHIIVGDEKNPIMTVCVSGGAGSGKSTLARAISKELSLPVFDLDQYIKGGYTKEQKEYDRRFINALFSCWQALPAKKGWIIEHIEAGNPYLLDAFKPSYLVQLDASDIHLRRVAGARTLAAGDKSSGSRVQRALESSTITKAQFDAAKGKVVENLRGCTMKLLTGG